MARSKRSVQETRTAWLDESGHESAGHATVLLAAVEVPTGQHPWLVSALRRCVRGPDGHLHWRDEHPDQRRWLLEILREHELTAWIVLEEGVPVKKKEAARARCLATMLDLLRHDGVSQLVIEGRPGGDHRDRQTALRSRSNVEIARFGTKREPMLWVADIVASVRAGSLTFPGGEHAMWGRQLQLWTEHVRTSDDLETMAFPRLAAFAEDGWTPPEAKSWPSFMSRLPALFARYRALGLKADRAAVSVRIAPAAAAPAVELSAQPGVGEIRYTLDGGVPGPTSLRYVQPLPLTGPMEVRAALFLDGEQLGPVAEHAFDPQAPASRDSQDLKLCNDGLALNLEGAPRPVRRTYLVNPVNACWIWPQADLGRARRVEIAFARLPFDLSLGAKWDTVAVRPPRQPTGEVEVRQDGCDGAPIAVAELPPGGVGQRASLTLPLPPRTGRQRGCASRCMRP